MKKQFKTKKELDKMIEHILESSGFYEGLEPFGIPKPDMHAIAAALESDGYDLDDLIANGHAYEIDGHTNNGWLYEDEVSPEFKNDVATKKRPANIIYKIKGYANYGVLKHERQIIFTYLNPHFQADVSEAVEIFLPEGFETYDNQMNQTLIINPKGKEFTVDEILMSWDDLPVMEWYDGQKTHRIKCEFEVIE